MAGASLSWLTQLSTAIASNISDVIAPLEQLFTIEYSGVGSDGVRVPTASTSFTLEDITPGTPGGTDRDYSFTGIDIKPSPRSIQIPIAEHHLETAQPSQIEDIINRFTEATHAKILALLGAAMKTRLVAGYQVGSGVGQTATASLIREAKWKARGNKAGGALSCLLTAGAMDQLEGDLESKNTFSALTSEIVDGAQFFRYSGILIHPDVYLGADTDTVDFNYLGTKDSFRIVYGGVGPKIKILPTTDPVNVRLAMAVWLAVDIPNPSLGCWIRSVSA